MVATDPGVFKRDEPYNGLPMLPPGGELETKAVLKAAIEAHTALADLRGAGRLIPDQGILVRAIALQEARLSSEIEAIVTTNDELYRELSREESKVEGPTKEVLRYGDAVWLGYGHLKKGGALDTEFFCRLASIVLKTEVGLREGPGTRVGDARTGHIVYTPPIGRERLARMLANLISYMEAENGVDPLVKIAVAHYQFEAIHPFRDANGRVGRVLNILYLIQAGLLQTPILYLSRAIMDDKRRYYSGLRNVTENGAWEAWILYMLDNIASTAIETRRRIEVIKRELDSAIEIARERMPKGYSKELIETVFEQPYTRIAFLERKGIAMRQTASEYLQALEEIGLLRSERRGREVYYVNDALLRALSL